MATYWVGASGNDSNDGTSYANRKLTMAAAITVASAKGDIINVVADDGPLPMTGTTPGTISGHSGSSEVDFGLRIRGVDNASENLTLAELAFTDDSPSNTQTMFNISGTSTHYLSLQGLKVDWAGMTNTHTNKNFFDRGSIQNTNIIIEACHFIFGQNQGGNLWIDSTTLTANSYDAGEFRYNYVDNTPSSGGTLISTHQRSKIDVHHNVIYLHGAWSHPRGFLYCQGNDGLGTDHRFYNNTIIEDGTSGDVNPIWRSDDALPASGTPVKHVHSNVIAVEMTTGSSFSYCSGRSSADPSNWNLTIGYSLFWQPNGPDLPTWGWYEIPFDEDDVDGDTDDFWSTDVEAGANPFVDDTVTWDWEDVGGTGYTITLDGDWRLTVSRDIAEDGGVPGALDGNAADLSASDMTINATPFAPVTESLIVTSSGAAPVNITNVSFAADSGGLLSYGGGTSYTIAAGSTQSLPLTFTPTTFPTSVQGTLTITHDGTSSPTVVTIYGKTPTYWIPGGGLPSRPVTPNSPAYYISPTSGDVGDGEGGIYTSIHLRKNTSISFEYTTKVGGYSDTAEKMLLGQAYISTNTALTDVPGLGQLTGLNKLMLQVYNADVTVKVNLQTWLIKAGGCFLLANSTSLNTFQLANANTIREARVHVFGSGGTYTDSAPTGSKRTGGRQSLNA